MKKDLCLLFFLTTSAPWVAAETVSESIQADFYVAPDGNDSYPGTEKQPFATLARARDGVRELKEIGPGRDYRVLLRGGNYRIRKTVLFSIQDSAPDGHTITYAAYPGERPILSPGVPVMDWRKIDSPPEDLPAKALGNVWSAPVPWDVQQFRTLFDGSRRLPRARSEGFRPLDEAKEWYSEDQSVFRFPKGTVRAWPNLSDVEVVIVPVAPWTMNILPLESVDEEAQSARTTVPGSYSLTQTRFGHFSSASAWIENTLSALDQPGEWVFDSDKRRIYLWPEGGNPDNDIVAPALTELIRVEGEIDYDGPLDKPVKGLVFRGLTFTQADRYTWEKEHTGWGLQHDWEMFDRPTAMVRLRGADACVIEQCRFVNSGATAIRLDLHCRENRIDGNEIEHIGGVGILLAGYGPGTKDVNQQNQITKNEIHHVGELYWHSPGIFVWQSGDNLIGNNLIHHTPYSAIVVSGRIVWDKKGLSECSRTIRWAETGEVSVPDPAGVPTARGMIGFHRRNQKRITFMEVDRSTTKHADLFATVAAQRARKAIGLIDLEQAIGDLLPLRRSSAEQRPWTLCSPLGQGSSKSCTHARKSVFYGSNFRGHGIRLTYLNFSSTGCFGPDRPLHRMSPPGRVLPVRGS